MKETAYLDKKSPEELRLLIEEAERILADKVFEEKILIDMDSSFEKIVQRTEKLFQRETTFRIKIPLTIYSELIPKKDGVEIQITCEISHPNQLGYNWFSSIDSFSEWITEELKSEESVLSVLPNVELNNLHREFREYYNSDVAEWISIISDAKSIAEEKEIDPQSVMEALFPEVSRAHK